MASSTTTLFGELLRNGETSGQNSSADNFIAKMRLSPYLCLFDAAKGTVSQDWKKP